MGDAGRCCLYSSFVGAIRVPVGQAQACDGPVLMHPMCIYLESNKSWKDRACMKSWLKHCAV
jgi:hypothetical protein